MQKCLPPQQQPSPSLTLPPPLLPSRTEKIVDTTNESSGEIEAIKPNLSVCACVVHSAPYTQWIVNRYRASNYRVDNEKHRK